MNNQGKQVDSGSGGNRRTYDCDICMRGFTNPQALGGHNNLHRRERQKNLSSSSSSQAKATSRHVLSQSLSFTNPSYDNNPPPFPTVESYHHQMFHPPVNPSYNTQRFGASSTSSGGGGGNYSQGEFLGLDLSLGLGSMNVDDTHRRPPESGGYQPQDDDLGLDLRLGGPQHH